MADGEPEGGGPLAQPNDPAPRLQPIGAKAYPGWTPAMVAAISGLRDRGRKWYSLYDKVRAADNLRWSWHQVAANRGAAGVDGQSVQAFGAQAELHLAELQRRLAQRRYQPLPVRRHWIAKPGKKKARRPLGIPAVRDRVVQAAVVNVLEPIFEAEFLDCSYGYRPGRSPHQALDRVSAALAQGQTWVVEVDIRGCFDTIPQEPLLDAVAQRVADGTLLALLRAFLRAGVLEGQALQPAEAGTPQGAVLSPLLCNIYLHRLDQALTARGYTLVRFADDFVVLCRSQAEAEAALAAVRHVLAELGLTLSEEKTRLVDVQTGAFTFLGYTFHETWRFPSDKALQRLRAKLKPVTRRQQPRRVCEVVAAVNPILCGWGTYFRHGHCQTRFARVDAWVRMRLRSFLWKRKARGRAHQLWPNAYWTGLGLFSLSTLVLSADPLRRGSAV
jgi:RNA-directed DNA polymerase